MAAHPSPSPTTDRLRIVASGRPDGSDRRAADPEERAPAVHFDFAFDPAFRVACLPFGIVASRAGVEVDDERVTARFGSWVVSTRLANVLSAEVTGPYHLAKVIGGPRVSLADRGLTFATNSNQGVCLRFVRPVRGIDPLGRIAHPGLTVTVAEPAALAELLEVAASRHASEPGPDRPIPVEELQQSVSDELSALTASELRDRARALGLSGVAKLRKAELIELLSAPDLGEGG
jgi:hypothetical protein